MISCGFVVSSSQFKHLVEAGSVDWSNFLVV